MFGPEQELGFMHSPCTIMNKVFGPERINLRYLAKRHTHIAADGIHGNIEAKMKKGKIHDFGDFLTCVNGSRKGVNTITMDNSFRNLTSKKRVCTKKVKLPHVNAIVEAAQKGSRNIFYRTSFNSDEGLPSDLLQKLVNYFKILDPDPTQKNRSHCQKAMPPDAM